MREYAEIRAERADFGQHIQLQIGKPLGDGHYAGGRVTFTEIEPGMFIEPTVSLRMTEAQLLMDELWRCGLRPTEGTGSAGSLAATQAHLADMKKLLFHSLGIQS